MERKEPTMTVHFEDGTIANTIKAAMLPVRRKTLERLSGMKYGRANIQSRTLAMLEKLSMELPNDLQLEDTVIEAAESVMIDYYLKDSPGILLYDIANDEYFLYVMDGSAPGMDYAILITRMVRNEFYDQGLQTDELLVTAYLDMETLIDNLRYFELESAEAGDFAKAASLRDLIKDIEPRHI